MFISKVALRNYKSIYSTPELIFRPGFNFITGQNNSGKTALLEMLSLSFDYRPHRSLVTLPNEGMELTAPSEIDLDFVLTDEEVKVLLQLRGTNADAFLPLAEQGNPFVRENGLGDPTRLVNWLLSQPELTFRVRLTRLVNSRYWTVRCRPSFGLYSSPVPAQTTATFVTFRVGFDFRVGVVGSASGDQNLEIGCQLAEMFQRFVYMFKAERFNIGRSGFGGSNVLAPNASNLPDVLNTLQGNPDKFEFFSKLVRSVLPQIKEVSVVPSGGQVEIRIWTIDRATRRVDLSRSLDECGTGVGQVLAILYAAVNSPRRGVLLIDEPQSFLHPGAARKLMQILREYPQHQYICSTHSASIISRVDPETITVTRLLDDKSGAIPQLFASQKAVYVFFRS
jgi:predicted ATPase